MSNNSTSESGSSSEDETTQYVLPENVYVKKMEEIIENRYFPDNKQMRCALVGNKNVDTTKNSERTLNPLDHTPTLPQLKQLGQLEEHKVETSKLTLDEFLNTYMGEDNASYDKLAKKERLKQLEEYKHFYKQQDQRFLEAPPDKDGRLHIMSHNAWKYTTENALMFNPSGTNVYTTEELMEIKRKSNPGIDPKATRLDQTIGLSVEHKLSQIRAEKLKQKLEQGKLDIDGKLNLETSPKKNDPFNTNVNSSLCTLVDYAQPEAQVPASPLMTWGHIDSTPSRLGLESKKPPGSEFSIAPISEREEIAHTLGSGISKNNANTIFKTPKYSVKRSTTPSSTTNMLSPAAIRLMNNKKFSTNRVLSSMRRSGKAMKTPTPIIRGMITPRKPPSKKKT